MNENRVTINELATKMVDELRRIGYSEETIWRNYHPKIRMVVNYYERAGITFYSLKSTDEMLKLYEERCERGEITNHYLRQMRCLNTSNIKECALDFSGIEVQRKELM